MKKLEIIAWLLFAMPLYFLHWFLSVLVAAITLRFYFDRFVWENLFRSVANNQSAHKLAAQETWKELWRSRN